MSERPAPRFASVDDLLADARSRLERVGPAEAARRVAAGARLVDIRPAWRLHPQSAARIPGVEGAQWIVFCTEGYTSSLAADALNSIGVPATDLEGGFAAWAAEGLPTVPGGTSPDHPTPG